MIKACDPTRLLVESDYPFISALADELWWMVETIAEVRGWPVERSAEDLASSEDVDTFGVVCKLKQNWKRFVEGSHTAKRQMNRKMRMDYSYQEYPDSDNND